MEYELSNHAAKRIKQRKIDERWVERALAEPDRSEQDRIDPKASHALKRIAEMDNRVLRVADDESPGLSQSDSRTRANPQLLAMRVFLPLHISLLKLCQRL